MISDKQKTVIIGLDGAPFNIIKEWSQAGILPNISKLIKEGIFSSLLSSFLPTSPVAWTTIMSGKNPGKHNVFDWGFRQDNSYRIATVNSRCVRTPLLWNILNQNNLSTGVFNVPITYPPSALNGFMVSGFDAPNTKVGYTYPEDLTAKIKLHLKDYPLFFRQSYVSGKENDFIEDIKYVINKKKEAISFLIDNFEMDFYIFVLMELDHLHHKMWGCFDSKEKAHYIHEVYKLIDETVGDIINRFPPETNFFIISDHGAGALEGVMYINNWLSQLGLLKVKKSPLMSVKNTLERLDLIPKIYEYCARLGIAKFLRALPSSLQYCAATNFLSFDDVDWSKTKAYSFGEYGQIYLNLKEREPLGIVHPGKEYDELVGTIIEALNKIEDPTSGKKLITKIHRKQEIYKGEYLHAAPDILFEIKDLSFDSSVKFGFGNKNIIGKQEFLDSGTHRREGILIAVGKNIKKNLLIDISSILDITPTILYSMELGIPADIDGKILKSIFTDEFIKGNVPYSTLSQEYKKPGVSDKADIDSVEQEEIKARLKSLGYMG